MSTVTDRLDQHDIRAAIRRQGQTLTGIARRYSLEESSCRVALLRRHRAGEQAIADFLGVSPADLWPDRYPATSRREATPFGVTGASPESLLLPDKGRAA